MTITFHPTHHRSTQPFNYQRLALVIVTIAAAALIAVAVNSTVNSTDTAPANGSVTAAAVKSVDQTGVAAFAQANGLSGLSPASAGVAVAAVESVDQAGVAAFAQANGLSGLSPTSVGPISPSVVSPAAVVSPSAVVPHTHYTLEANRGVQPIELPRHVQELTASAADQADASAAPPTAQTATTLSPHVPFGAIPQAPPSSTAAVELPHRSNFASDTDWISANGWD